MTTERDSTMTLEQVRDWHVYERDDYSGHAEMHQRMIDAIDAHLATRNAVVSDDDVMLLRRFVDEHDGLMIEWDTAKATLESLASRKVAVPNGYVLVPVEPTSEMLESGHNCIDWCREKQNTHFMDHPSQHDGGTTCEQDLRDAYAAMLNAAPSDKSMLTSRKVAVPDAMYVGEARNPFRSHEIGEGYACGWNACRKAMLASQDEVK